MRIFNLSSKKNTVKLKSTGDIKNDTLLIIKQWMNNCPIMEKDELLNLFKYYANAWHVDYMEGNSNEIFELFEQCLNEDQKHGPLDTKIMGIDGKYAIGDIKVDFAPPFWKVIPNSVIQILFYGYHLIGKFSDDQFLFLVHDGGTIANIIRNR